MKAGLQRGRTHRRGRIALALAVASATVAPLAWSPTAVSAAEARLTIFDGLAASQSVYIQPRANSVFALPADQLIGATAAEINSQPRAQGYAATWGVPLAANLRGVGIPIDYYGQCYANYPGEASVECGVPVKELTPPKAPENAQGGGGAFGAHAEASGEDTDPEKARGKGFTEAGGMFVEGALRIGYNRSQSETFIEDGIVHAVTHSVAQDVTVAEVLKIGSVEAIAEATHAGDAGAATGAARTEMQNVTIGGVPVTIGPDGLMVQGQPLGQAPTPAAKPVLDAMAAQGMTIEPLPAPTVSRDAATGLVEARTSGFRVQLLSPNGDGKFEMVFGRAIVRAGAVRAEDDVPFEIPVGDDPDRVPIDGSAPAAAPVLSEASVPDMPAADLGGAGTTPASGFTSFDPAYGSVLPASDVVSGGVVPGGVAVTSPVATATGAARPPAATQRVQLAALPSELDDVSSRVMVTYAAAAAVVLAGLGWALRSNKGRRWSVQP